MSDLPNPKFRFEQEVIINSGFYWGCVGRLVEIDIQPENERFIIQYCVEIVQEDKSHKRVWALEQHLEGR